jgi:hypothetical protein
MDYVKLINPQPVKSRLCFFMDYMKLINPQPVKVKSRLYVFFNTSDRFIVLFAPSMLKLNAICFMQISLSLTLAPLDYLLKNWSHRFFFISCNTQISCLANESCKNCLARKTEKVEPCFSRTHRRPIIILRRKVGQRLNHVLGTYISAT